MRLAGFTQVRNEEDVIEASIRHNLRSLDALSVVDHGSDDATPQILAALLREGLPIQVGRDDTIEFRQGDAAAEGVRRSFADGADACIALDADEFLCVPSRERFEAVVSQADPSRRVVLPSLTYLPALDAAGDIVSRLKRARREADERRGPGKRVVRRREFDAPGAPVDAAASGEHETLDGSIAAIAHVPVRSVGQFTAKIAVGCLAVRLAAQDGNDIPSHWQHAFDDLLAGRPLTHERLAQIAASYGGGRDRHADPATVAWHEDPLPLDVELRYTPSRPPNPLARILTFGERVAAEVARTTGGR